MSKGGRRVDVVALIALALLLLVALWLVFGQAVLEGPEPVAWRLVSISAVTTKDK